MKDLNDFKKEVNNELFQEELFNILKKTQEKYNSLIDENNLNETSLNNIRNSEKDIKISYMKALDELKNNINIKDIY